MSQQRTLYSAKRQTMFCHVYGRFQISLAVVIITSVSETVRLPMTELHGFFFSRSADLQNDSLKIYFVFTTTRIKLILQTRKFLRLDALI